MDELPEVVRVALLNACNSGRTLFWKVQESTKGTLIQLVWKPMPVICLDKGHTVRVGSNLNVTKQCAKTVTVAECDKPADKPPKKKRNNPSKVCRNARRLRSFLDRKLTSGSKPEVAKFTVDSALTADKESNGLMKFIEENVDCVSDVEIREGEPSLHLELSNGDHMWTPVHVRHVKLLSVMPTSTEPDIPVCKLLELDSIEYCGREPDNAPGVVLKKGGLEVWTPNAARLRPRIRDK